MKKYKSITEDYAMKLRKINETMTHQVMAKRLDVYVRTMTNWFADAGVIKLKYAERIDKLYNEVTK